MCYAIKQRNENNKTVLKNNTRETQKARKPKTVDSEVVFKAYKQIR